MAEPVTSAQAHVQRLCLAEIQHADVGSVTELAVRLGSVRPTVSRAVNELVRRGLVARDGRRLLLTEAGREEVDLVSRAARQRLPKAARAADLTAKLAMAAQAERDEPRRPR